MEFFKQALLLVLTEKCYDEYFLKFNFLDGKFPKFSIDADDSVNGVNGAFYVSVPCFKASLSKGLGIGIIAGSILVKVPQIVKILKNKSGDGISVLSVTLDLVAITIAVAYSYVSSFPFSSWGDGAFLAIQTVAIGILVLYYAKETTKACIYFICYVGLCVVLMGGLTPLNVLWSLQAMNIPILLTGKLSQAYLNYKNGSTGQLSAATVFMLFGGSAARIFTSIQETGDSMLIFTYCASTFANAVIVSQMLYYWNADVSKKQKQKKVK